MMVDPNSCYRLSQQAAVRPEHFGGLIYRHDTRKLYVVHSRPILDLLVAFRNGRTLGEVLADCGSQWNNREALWQAIAYLTELDVVERVPATGEPVVGADASARPSRGEGDWGQRKVKTSSGLRAPESQAAFREGLASPICLTWEITYACNLRCRHCLSSSGDRRLGELSTGEAKQLIDEWAEMKVFYINVGGGEPMLRDDFFELMDYALDRGIGVKFSTNGTLIDDTAADWIASRDYLDLQISLDGADVTTNDALRGPGSYDAATQAMRLLAARGASFKISTVLTRQNYADLDRFYTMSADYSAQLRLTRLRPSGRGRSKWHELRPTRDQNLGLYEWLLAHPDVLTGDSFFHLSALGLPLDGLNLCGAGRIVCCVSPIGDVYACPFLQMPGLSQGNVRAPGGFTGIWRARAPFVVLRRSQTGGACDACVAFSSCAGGCPAVKYSTGIPVDCPDPDCALGGEPLV